MRPWLIVVSLTMTLVHVLAADAVAAPIGPSKASQLVTLRNSGIATCPGSTAILLDEMHLPNGTVVPFTGPSAKQVLIISDIQMSTITAGGGLVHFIVARSNGTTGSTITSVFDTASAAGAASASITLPVGTALQPGTSICVCANDGACNGNTVVTVHGYFAPNK